MSTAIMTRATLAFRVEPRPFVSAVAWVAKRIPNRPSPPILAGIVLRVTDGTLTLSGFDYDVATRAHLPVTSDSDGHVVVSGRLLDAIAKTFPDKPVDVTVDGNKVLVKCGGLKLTLPTMPVADYPSLPDVPDPIGTVAAGDFGALVERVAVAADGDAHKGVPELVGVHLRFGAEAIDLMGSDRYRAAVGAVPWIQTVPGVGITALVPANPLLDVGKTLSGLGGDIAIGIDNAGLVGFSTATRSVVMRQIAGSYPERQITQFAAIHSDTPVTVAVAELSAALKRADFVRADKSAAVLLITADGLTVTAASEGGDAATDEVINCEYAGQPMTVGINPRYLLDGLAALRSDTAVLSFTAPKRPVLLAAPGEDPAGYRHVIVPIRLS